MILRWLSITNHPHPFFQSLTIPTWRVTRKRGLTKSVLWFWRNVSVVPCSKGAKISPAEPGRKKTSIHWLLESYPAPGPKKGRVEGTEEGIAKSFWVALWVSVDAPCHELGMLVQTNCLQDAHLRIVSDDQHRKLFGFDLPGPQVPTSVFVCLAHTPSQKNCKGQISKLQQQKTSSSYPSQEDSWSNFCPNFDPSPPSGRKLPASEIHPCSRQNSRQLPGQCCNTSPCVVRPPSEQWRFEVTIFK